MSRQSYLSVACLVSLLTLVPASSKAGEVGMASAARSYAVDVGVFAGGFFPSTRHDLYGGDRSAWQPLSLENAAVGARAAYYLSSRLGAEGELGWIAGSTENGDSVRIIPIRAHVVVRGSGGIQPFVVAGASQFFSSSDALGSDRDPGFYWGFGARIPILESMSLRLDARHNLTGGHPTNGRNQPLTSHFEVLLGFGMSLLPSGS